MEINKNFYMKLDNKLQIVAAEAGHKSLPKEELEALQNALQTHIDDGSLFAGEKATDVELNAYDMATGEKVTTKRLHNVCKLEVPGTDGHVRVVEYNVAKRALRAWVANDEYKKKSSDTNQSGDGNPEEADF